VVLHADADIQIGLRLDAIYGNVMLRVGLGCDASCVDIIPRHALFWMESCSTVDV
jgi:hypothetical protein